MNDLIAFSGPTLPRLITAAGDQARTRFLEFFIANIRNHHTRRAYMLCRSLQERKSPTARVFLRSRTFNRFT
jgi:hypothetical protein